MQKKPMGLGITQGWLWLLFLNGPLLFKTIARFSGKAETLFLLFIFSHCLSFLTVAVFGGKFPARFRNPFLITGAGLMVLGTFWIIWGPPGQFWAYGTVVVLAGVGSAWLVTGWGTLFSGISVRDGGVLYALGVAIGTVLFFAGSYVDITKSVILTALLPVVTVILLVEKGAGGKERGQGDKEKPERGYPFNAWFTMLLVVYYLAGGFMFKIVSLGASFPTQETYWVTNVIYGAVCLGAGLLFYLNPNFDLKLLYRPVLPLLGAGFILFPLFNKSWGAIPFTLFQAGFALFDMYTWLLFTFIAARRQNPTVVFGWGLFIITGSIFTGEIVFTFGFSFISELTKQTESVSVVAALIMFAASLLFRGEKESFTGWRTEEKDSSRECQTPLDKPGGTKLEPEIVAQCNQDMPRLFIEEFNLTVREKEVTLLLLTGRNNPHIRECLNISTNTLKTHLRNVFIKISISNRQELLNLYNSFCAGQMLPDEGNLPRD